MDHPGKVASPARGQLNRENEGFPVPVPACESGLARRVRPSRPAPANLFSILRLNMVLTQGIPLPISAAASIYLARTRACIFFPLFSRP